MTTSDTKPFFVFISTAQGRAAELEVEGWEFFENLGNAREEDNRHQIVEQRASFAGHVAGVIDCLRYSQVIDAETRRMFISFAVAEASLNSVWKPKRKPGNVGVHLHLTDGGCLYARRLTSAGLAAVRLNTSELTDAA